MDTVPPEEIALALLVAETLSDGAAIPAAISSSVGCSANTTAGKLITADTAP